MITTTENEIPPAEERMADFPEPPTQGVAEVKRWNRLLAIYLVVTALALSVSVIVGAIAIGWQQEADGRASRNATAAAEAKTEAQAATSQGQAAVKGIEEANRRLAALGKPTVPVPTIQPPSAQPVPEGLSGSQLAAVQVLIANQLAAYQPQFSPATVRQIATQAAALVPKPANGKTPTTADLQPIVLAAQAAYCATGRCDAKPPITGPTGPAGPTGKPGADGTPGTDGKNADPVTDEQLRPLIAERLTAYCAADGDPCRGLRGEQGERGGQGVQGRSLAGMDCSPDGRWRLYFVDPTKPGEQETVYVDGPCRVLLPPPTEAARKTK